MSKGVTWFGQRLVDDVQRRLRKNMTRACIHLRGAVVDSISDPGPTKTHPENAPSLVWDPPHKRTGALRRSIAYEVSPSGLVGRVGTNLKYGWYLEEGTLDMSPRPYLRPALDRERQRIAKILTGSGP